MIGKSRKQIKGKENLKGKTTSMISGSPWVFFLGGSAGQNRKLQALWLNRLCHGFPSKNGEWEVSYPLLLGRVPPPKFNTEPEKWMVSNRSLLFQGLIFRWTMFNFKGVTRLTLVWRGNWTMELLLWKSVRDSNYYFFFSFLESPRHPVIHTSWASIVWMVMFL